MNGRLEYISSIYINPELNFFSLNGMNYDEICYIAGKLSNGEIIEEHCWFLKDVKFNFSELGKFFFPHSTVREIRKRIIEKYEERYGGGSAEHIEDMIEMPWERIWRIVRKKRLQLERKAASYSPKIY